MYLKTRANNLKINCCVMFELDVMNVKGCDVLCENCFMFVCGLCIVVLRLPIGNSTLWYWRGWGQATLGSWYYTCHTRPSTKLVTSIYMYSIYFIRKINRFSFWISHMEYLEIINVLLIVLVTTCTAEFKLYFEVSINYRCLH